MRLMPLPKVPGTSAAAVRKIEGGVARMSEDADKGGGLALPRARHDVEIRHDLGVLDLGDRFPQQVLRDRELEERVVGHRGTLSLTPTSGPDVPGVGRDAGLPTPVTYARDGGDVEVPRG